MINPERLARWSSVLSRVKLDHEAKSTTGTEFRKAALTPAIASRLIATQQRLMSFLLC